MSSPFPLAILPDLLKSLAVVVPVYNGVAVTASLVGSLAAVVPKPRPGLRFVFSDDASPDRAIEEVFAHPFFSRPDVTLIRKPRNEGFIRNVNSAVASLAPGEDILILNSDTEIHSDVFSVLQAEAYAEADIASVTPLTNNGTLASLFKWPDGGAAPAYLTPAVLARTVARLRLSSPPARVPTGVGFCMYIRRDAWDRVGALDEVFGKGYGEECDWCRRAVKRGYVHLVSSRAFVAHMGTQSFLGEDKLRALAANHRILLDRHPEYFSEIADYFERNPLKFHRIVVILAALRGEVGARPAFLLATHIDPRAATGGTEKHVDALAAVLAREGHIAVEIFPDGGEQFKLRIRYLAETCVEEDFHRDALPGLIEFLAPFCDYLHVHHLLYWPEAAIQALARAPFRRKAITGHDLWLLCPSINLLRAPEYRDFCGVEQDLEACNRCLKTYPGQAHASIEVHRARIARLLESFDVVLFPSDAVLPHFAQAFPADWPRIGPKVRILPHDLTALFALAQPASAETCTESGGGSVGVGGAGDRLAFVGALGAHKGSRSVLEALPELRAQGFAPEIIGCVAKEDIGKFSDVPVFPYATDSELRNRLAERRPAYVAFPAIWPETFCYAFFEAMILAPDAVPVVGPYGNPARVAREAGLGTVMKSVGPMSLVEACVDARAGRGALLPAKVRYLAALADAQRPYYGAYVEVFGSEARAAAQVAAIPALSGQALHVLAGQDFFSRKSLRLWQENFRLLTERKSFVLKIAIRFQGFLHRHPRLKFWFAPVARKLVRGVKVLRGALRSARA